MKRGDRVIITAAGKTVHGLVAIASENGKSLWVMFDGLLGGHLGAVPGLLHDDGTFRSIIDGMEMTITPIDAWTDPQ